MLPVTAQVMMVLSAMFFPFFPTSGRHPDGAPVALQDQETADHQRRRDRERDRQPRPDADAAEARRRSPAPSASVTPTSQ